VTGSDFDSQAEDTAARAATARSRTAFEEAFPTVLCAARAGEEWAWAALYRELAAPLFGYLRAQRAPEPDDLLGETFLQLVRDLPQFSGDGRAFRAWAFSLAHHRVIDERRQRARRPVEPVEDAPDRADLRGDVVEDALAELAEERVQRLLDGLSPDQRSVLLLRIVGDLTVEEVARAVGKRPGAVKALQRRGLAAIRRELEREGVPL
jgi:RNA polymerase sigma factor (sigma-70 family)